MSTKKVNNIHDNEYLSRFGIQLKMLRKNMGFTQEEMSNKLNISKHSIINYEKSKRFPDSTFIIQLVIEFNVSANWLLVGIGNMYLNECQNITSKDLLELNEISENIPEIKQTLLGELTKLKGIFKEKVAEYEKSKKKPGTEDADTDASGIKAG